MSWSHLSVWRGSISHVLIAPWLLEEKCIWYFGKQEDQKWKWWLAQNITEHSIMLAQQWLLRSQRAHHFLEGQETLPIVRNAFPSCVHSLVTVHIPAHFHIKQQQGTPSFSFSMHLSWAQKPFSPSWSGSAFLISTPKPCSLTVSHHHAFTHSVPSDLPSLSPALSFKHWW
jgi:hypothetical protein